MDNVVATCKKCDWRLGSFVNLWTQIGKSYISPVIIKIDQELSIITSGSVRPGEKQTLVDHCQLQDISCSQCRAVLGVECVETPANHVLQENQLMFRLSSIAISDLNQQNDIEFNIQRTLKLRNGPRSSLWPEGHTPGGEKDHQGIGPEEYDQKGNNLNAEDGVDFVVLQADLDAQREDILRINSAGHQIVSALDSAMSRIEGEIKKLKKVLSDLQRDRDGQDTKDKSVEKNISSLKAEVQHLKTLAGDDSKSTRFQDEIAAAKQTISSVQDILSTLNISSQTVREEVNSMRSDLGAASTELKALRKEMEATKNIAKDSVAAAKANAKDTLAVRAELQQVKETLARIVSERQTQPSDRAFPSEQLEILTRNITIIGNRASQVEPLQMELELLKGRVQRVESHNTPAANDRTISPFPRHEAARTGDARRAQTDVSRKRKLPDANLAEMQELSSSSATSPAKRAALADWSSSPAGYYAPLSSPPSSATRASPKTRLRPRLTKSGVIDKRTLPRGSKKLTAEKPQRE